MKKLNFGRNVQIDSDSYFTPKTEAEVLAILNQVKGRSIRCMGRLHSWSQVLDSPDVLLDLSHLDSVRPNSGVAMSVDVGAGCQIKRLLSELEGKLSGLCPQSDSLPSRPLQGPFPPALMDRVDIPSRITLSASASLDTIAIAEWPLSSTSPMETNSVRHAAR